MVQKWILKIEPGYNSKLNDCACMWCLCRTNSFPARHLRLPDLKWDVGVFLVVCTVEILKCVYAKLFSSVLISSSISSLLFISTNIYKKMKRLQKIHGQMQLQVYLVLKILKYIKGVSWNIHGWVFCRKPCMNFKLFCSKIISIF